MVQNNFICIEVAYAAPDKQIILEVSVPENSTIETAIQHSGILNRFPEIDLSQNKVGVFGKPRTLFDIVKQGDRVQIYRPLIIDPKEARRAKARKG